ncbi:hypothetical protein [Nocardioides sp. CFH 31398]|nr:hypothetical protein [Nocardioides sp. CFH 31398]
MTTTPPEPPYENPDAPEVIPTPEPAPGPGPGPLPSQPQPV